MIGKIRLIAFKLFCVDLCIAKGKRRQRKFSSPFLRALVLHSVSSSDSSRSCFECRGHFSRF